MADQQTHTRWTRTVAKGAPAEHVIVSSDGHGNWSVIRSWTLNSGDVALAWAKSLIEPQIEEWVEYGPSRTGVTPPS